MSQTLVYLDRNFLYKELADFCECLKYCTTVAKCLRYGAHGSWSKRSASIKPEQKRSSPPLHHSATPMVFRVKQTRRAQRLIISLLWLFLRNPSRHQLLRIRLQLSQPRLRCIHYRSATNTASSGVATANMGAPPLLRAAVADALDEAHLPWRVKVARLILN